MTDRNFTDDSSGGVGKLVLFRLTSMEQAVRTLTDQVGKLVLIEERQSQMFEAQERAFRALSELERRVRTLELVEPITRRTNVWVERAVLAAIGAAAGMAVKVFLH
ncbi:MAG: hypothetical protein WCZ20_01380 [Hydrogenophaga sp.]|nr:hypothetical protein [Ottowia sp.]